MHKRVLVYRELPPDQLERIAGEHEVIVANPRLPEQEQAFMQALPRVHALIGSGYPITEALLDQARHLEVISAISVGVDHYPLPALRERGIVLCHTPGVLTETVADLMFAMILCSSRRVCELARHVAQGHWTRSIGDALFGWDVHGKTLGLLGYGRIGQALARRAALGFDMPVLYYARRPDPSAELEGRAKHATLEQVLQESDFVAVVLPLTDQTRGLIGAPELAMMKPGSILVNGARGPIVHEAALVDALDRGPLRAAALDVFEVEPLPLDSPLRNHPNVLTLPHAGSATHETRRAMADMATTNLLLALQGQPPLAVYAS